MLSKPTNQEIGWAPKVTNKASRNLLPKQGLTDRALSFSEKQRRFSKGVGEVWWQDILVANELCTKH